MNDFDLLTLEVSSSDELPDGGFFMDDSQLLVFVPNYFEDELHDVPEEDEWNYDELLLDDYDDGEPPVIFYSLHTGERSY